MALVEGFSILQSSGCRYGPLRHVWDHSGSFSLAARRTALISAYPHFTYSCIPLDCNSISPDTRVKGKRFVLFPYTWSLILNCYTSGTTLHFKVFLHVMMVCFFILSHLPQIEDVDMSRYESVIASCALCKEFTLDSNRFVWSRSIALNGHFPFLYLDVQIEC